MMLDWEATLTDCCCKLQVIISLIMMIMSEAQRSDIKGKWEVEVVSDQTKKAACALCRNFVEILSM
jgi:hypothetical protein